MLIVAALGGNALIRRGESLGLDEQLRNVAAAAASLAALVREHTVVITHGNGPQVGLLALQAESFSEVPPYPLDVLDAESEGMIGYLLGQALGNALPSRSVATLLTQVVVDAHDPAFANPTKPIGPQYSAEDARERATTRGWTVAPDGPDGWWRRVVGSPAPLAIVELPAIRALMDAGFVVIAVGGGGVPVTRSADGTHHGVEAVIDKDAAAALLAERIGADRLLLLTDVPAVELSFGTPHARPVGVVDTDTLGSHEFAPGSMGPKVDAARRFVDATGQVAVIGSIEAAAALANGEAGTVVVPSVHAAGAHNPDAAQRVSTE